VALPAVLYLNLTFTISPVVDNIYIGELLILYTTPFTIGILSRRNTPISLVVVDESVLRFARAMTVPGAGTQEVDAVLYDSNCATPLR